MMKVAIVALLVGVGGFLSLHDVVMAENAKGAFEAVFVIIGAGGMGGILGCLDI